ncbi:50S ribosomal protein L11 methyltransferase [Hankyongella ginsenosidimutans]|uniref:50S ribosomal protein L11 methyltransferase n=1 Tax=Hankyongella ginsenosidimutans TaxID=1763828 RepID=UPI002482A5B5|nr:50S ribosomal protein L11 methyltransferase [Hankyongella ginsenosidimutans]
MAHARFRRALRFDLLVANILAGPLVALAPTLTARLNPGGYLLLAGLLAPQAQAVLGAYRARGLNLVHELGDREWPTLLLRKGRVSRLPPARMEPDLERFRLKQPCFAPNGLALD